jgi:nitrile hydratase subunit beta
LGDHPTISGVHDMGGMTDIGPIHREADEPVFHQPWEARVFALWRVLLTLGKWRTSRVAIESIQPTQYLRMTYYERILAALSDLLVNTKVISPAELESGIPDTGNMRLAPPLPASLVPAWIAQGTPARRRVAVTPHFTVGQRVRARHINPTGHTRLPRYVRGKVGTVERDYGVFALPDTYVYFLEDKPQHLYAVRFAARELWGDRAHANDVVYVDIWDDYLEPA